MAKGASTEKELGVLHAGLTRIFTKVLKNYEDKLDLATKTIEDMQDELEEDLLGALVSLNVEPSPAMLSAMSKFLKDNEITFDSEELDELSVLEQRLQDKKKNRPDFSNVTQLPLTGTED